VIDPDEARRIEPGLGREIVLAAHCPIDGHVTAYLTGRGYAGALREAGVTVMEHAPVAGLDAGDGGYRLRGVQGPLLSAARVVLAGGVWLEQMLGWLGVRVPVKVLVNQLAVTERMAPCMGTVLSVASGLLSLKQFANGTVLIGGGWQGRGDRDLRTTDILPDNLIGNVRLAAHVVPALRGTRLARAWLGFEAETADALPALGPVPGHPGAFVAGSVHSGYTSGPAIGRALARLMLGEPPGLALFPIDRLLTQPQQETCPA
jgi:glycine/D-amino acid oxidase-like deaminating enzyme